MIIDWKKIAQNIYQELENEIKYLDKKPKMCVIMVWNNPNSRRYVNQKQKICTQIWMNFEEISLDENIAENELLQIVENLNNDENINGFILQLPVPAHINVAKVIEKINPIKDVDWFTPINQWKAVINDNSWLFPCTPAWVMEIFKSENIKLEWKNIVMVWASNIVGKPLSNMLINQNATVTTCNSKTTNLEFYTKNADIVISATWVIHLIKKEMLKTDAIIIDVGFTVKDWVIYWDCDFNNIESSHLITPVPGWVGPLTIALLLKNTLKAYTLQNEKN